MHAQRGHCTATWWCSFALHCLVSRRYSTCSFNPLENEAVVCAALTAMRGEVQLEAPPREWWTQRGLQTRWVCPLASA